MVGAVGAPCGLGGDRAPSAGQVATPARRRAPLPATSRCARRGLAPHALVPGVARVDAERTVPHGHIVAHVQEPLLAKRLAV